MSFTPEPFVIQEDISNGLRVELKDSDLPFGRARELVAFETGGRYEIADDGIYNPGSKRPVLQMMQAKQRPLVVKGAFRDRLWGTKGHARQMRNQLEQIRLRANPVKISWAGDQRIGILQETKFGEQSSTDIEYELTFFVAVPQDGVSDNSRNDQSTNSNSSMADKSEALKSLIISLIASQASLALSGSMNNTLANMFATVSSSIDNLSDSATLLEKQTLATPQQAVQGVNRVLASAEAARQNAQDIQDEIDSTRFDSAIADPTNTTSTAAWWNFASNASDLMNQIFDQLRTIKIQATETVRTTTRLYRVQPGDTLESIAISQMGSRAKASDLGIGPDALIPGHYIRIPEDK